MSQLADTPSVPAGPGGTSWRVPDRPAASLLRRWLDGTALSSGVVPAPRIVPVMPEPDYARIAVLPTFEARVGALLAETKACLALAAEMLPDRAMQAAAAQEQGSAGPLREAATTPHAQRTDDGGEAVNAGPSLPSGAPLRRNDGEGSVSGPPHTEPAEATTPHAQREPQPDQPTPPATNRGRLKNGAAGGDPTASPRCGARTRAGGACLQPAMANGRCRLHGGKNTGACSKAGMDRIRAAATKHGGWSAESRAYMRATSAFIRSTREAIALARQALDPMRPAPHSQSPLPVAPPTLLR